MRDQTALHLSTADENRAFAQALTTGSATSAASSRWAVVIAFYATVHYVNAYLWNRLQIEPSTHFERGRFIRTISDLRPVDRHYTRLEALSRSAHYVPGSRVSLEEAQMMIDIDLEAVRAAVLRSLERDA